MQGRRKTRPVLQKIAPCFGGPDLSKQLFLTMYPYISWIAGQLFSESVFFCRHSNEKFEIRIIPKLGYYFLQVHIIANHSDNYMQIVK